MTKSWQKIPGIGNKVFWWLTPFLLFYFLVIILFSADELVGDENRYLWFAENLLRGFYSPSYPNIHLWNTPGYPMVIAPFLFLGLPLMAIRLLNGLFLFLSLFVCYKTLLHYVPQRMAFYLVVLLGLYYPAYPMLPLILTESLSWFLISLIIWLFVNIIRESRVSWPLIIATSASIAFLAMVKAIFGYVIVLMIIVSACLFPIPRLRQVSIRSTSIFGLSLLLCIPYLLYTYNLTGKIFYWANSGGMTLYTMSTPYNNELGDWMSKQEMQANPNHQNFIDSIEILNPVERDEAYLKAAIKNIRNHPVKYMLNWLDNIGRMLFNYPYTIAQSSHRTYFFSIPNMFVFVFMVIALALSIIRFRYLPPELFLLLMFIGIYLFGSSLLSAYRRMFYITMPFWTFYIGVVFGHLLSVTWKSPDPGLIDETS